MFFLNFFFFQYLLWFVFVLQNGGKKRDTTNGWWEKKPKSNSKTNKSPEKCCSNQLLAVGCDLWREKNCALRRWNCSLDQCGWLTDSLRLVRLHCTVRCFLCFVVSLFFSFFLSCCLFRFQSWFGNERKKKRYCALSKRRTVGHFGVDGLPLLIICSGCATSDHHRHRCAIATWRMRACIRVYFLVDGYFPIVLAIASVLGILVWFTRWTLDRADAISSVNESHPIEFSGKLIARAIVPDVVANKSSAS